MTSLDGRVAIVTGAGGGLGREHALALAGAGAKVLVNDVGGALDGTGADTGPAQSVVGEIKERFGADAIANVSDVSSEEGAAEIVAQALSEFGRLDVVVNNAGISRDRVLINMSYDDWDSVIRVHLRGTFGVSRAAALHWRALSKDGVTNDARIINTFSPSGLFGNPGQTNYSAAKAGIAAFTLSAARELDRYGVTVNAISPVARTRMTALMPNQDLPPEGEFDRIDPANVSPVVAWLASSESAHVNGRVLAVVGGRIAIAEGWRYGPTIEQDHRWEIEVHPAG